MARALKPQKVWEVSHESLPIKIEIMLDRNDLDFFFELAGKRIRAADIDEIKKLAKDHIGELAKVEWEAVIDVRHETRYGHRNFYGDPSKLKPNERSADLDLAFSRYERGKFEGAWKLKRKHILDVEEGSYEMRKRIEQPHAGDWYSGHGTVIPYTDEAWNALHAIVTGLHDMNRKLEALLDDEATATKLLSGLGTKPLLPPFVPYYPSVTPEAERPKRGRTPRTG